MLWLIRLAPRLALRFWFVLLATLIGMAVGAAMWLRQLQQTWGVVPADVERNLPGDELVPDAGIVETRSLAIDAAADEIWPWLAQMGYERGGWYSYDRLDTKSGSADELLPEFHDLAEGDLVPTHPGGGFIARVVDPGRTLVLYLDSALVRDQMESSVAEHGAEALEEPGAEPVGLELAGALGDMTMPEFQGSWAFSLEPRPEGGTWLIERMRLSTADAGLPQRLGLPVMGFGVFAMTRKHMLGVKERAERPSGNGVGSPPETTAA